MSWDSVREFLQNVFTAIGLFWTIRYGIPIWSRHITNKYGKRKPERERT